MLSRKQKLFLYKLFSLFSVVRVYNILIIVIAQYLAAKYILAPKEGFMEIILDGHLLAIVLASAVAIAAGYIINNFYDAEKDLINRPNKSMLDRLVSKRTKLTTYFILNFISVAIASIVSFNSFIFFSAYIFGIWFYSHKLKKIPFIGNLTSAVLAITPFFAVFIYYKNLSSVIFVHAAFLFLLILIREFIKDLENIKGDLAQDYKTIPVMYGEKVSKGLITFSAGIAIAVTVFLISRYDTSYMLYYFYGSIGLLIISVVILYKSTAKSHYILLHNILKFIIVSGVFSIPLLNIDVILNKITRVL
ncbi:geranylgeranylglycerol-phosphate geranylgeranyltransferase [Kordia sp.]|uniref:geranylgeranylglycerol-phosphate geranylgeranyltransferase n=1 Tax=Kordia sp. TaxID=1965332 RepID=UPI0025BDD126|nr:geranylgeranylglycerol-phosphate geranylgeranyltransferase [Kordia sp.]MCH2196279.1 geranylgeranylglycerol-phosphate geranylgeranyltransferase [Kordia sp.]